MKIALPIIFLFFSTFAGKAQLSGWSDIYLLTYRPGNEIYSIFGHSAIRVRDPINNIDLVYNYGTFDFNTNYFILKFIRGNLQYQLSRTTFEAAMQQMVFENRAVVEQQLNLNHHQRNELFNRLEKAYLPENRFYVYRFFNRNCATLIRDDVEAVLNDSLLFQNNKAYHTFRRYIHQYTHHKPWLKLGIDLLLNSKADITCDASQTMFLPDFLSKQIRATEIDQKNIPEGQLSDRPIEILEPTITRKKESLRPYLVFSLLLVVFLGINITSRIHAGIKYRSRQGVFGIISVLGLFILFVSSITRHPELSGNLNLIWTLPAIGFFIIHVLNHRLKTIIKHLFYLVYILLLVLLFLFNHQINQYIPTEVIPVFLMLISASLLEMFLPVKKN